jgi:hypothetical protein
LGVLAGGGRTGVRVTGMSLVGVNRIDDGIKSQRNSGAARQVINVEAELVDEVNEFAGELSSLGLGRRLRRR